ncbi:hypothetical protein [Cetobacterium sp.]|uniref:hypothetical protein n=1 Tax=Cetobacterium sp. TaxID=2071632 RepID=UPI003F39F95D
MDKYHEELNKKINYLQENLESKNKSIDELERKFNFLQNKIYGIDSSFSFYSNYNNKNSLMKMVSMFEKRKGYLSSHYFELYMKVSDCIEERMKFKDFNLKHEVITETIEELENEYTSLEKAIEEIKQTAGLIKLQLITRGILKKYGG